MAKAKTEKKELSPEERKLHDELQKEIAALIQAKIKGKNEAEVKAILEATTKVTTEVTKSKTSSLVNQKYQQYVDNLNSILPELKEVFKKGKEIVAVIGKDRKPRLVKLAGYNSSTGDIYVDFKNDAGMIENKMIKADSVITDVSKIPPPAKPPKTARIPKK